MNASNTPQPWQELTAETAHQNPWYSVVKKNMINPSGNRGEYYIVNAPDAVTCVCVTPDKKVLIERQYRPPIGKISVDFPAGAIDKSDASPEAAMLRELQEETGYQATTIEKLAVIDKDPGISTSKMHIFLVQGVTQGLATPEDSESIVSEFLPAEEILRMVYSGEISCANCVSATFFAFSKLGWLTPTLESK